MEGKFTSRAMKFWEYYRMTVISCCSVEGGTCRYSKEYTANHLIMQTVASLVQKGVQSYLGAHDTEVMQQPKNHAKHRKRNCHHFQLSLAGAFIETSCFAMHCHCFLLLCTTQLWPFFRSCGVERS